MTENVNKIRPTVITENKCITVRNDNVNRNISEMFFVFFDVGAKQMYANIPASTFLKKNHFHTEIFSAEK